MDLSTTTTLAGGLASAIVLLFGYLLRAIVSDRRDFQAQIAGERARSDEERVRADDVQDRIDVELERRREAEQAAALCQAELATARHRLAYYKLETRRLRAHLPPGPILPDVGDDDSGV